MVLTHGEPHPGNLLRAGGRWLLIDWETALVAPPERDLWPGNGSFRDAYVRRGGRDVRPEVIELYRLRWRLSEIALYTALFRGEHGDTEDERLSWRGFVGYVRGE
jgi:spectinomycin phosphotransferase